VDDKRYSQLVEQVAACAVGPDGSVERWLIAASGGPDSTALAILANAAGIELSLAYVIHAGARPPSACDVSETPAALEGAHHMAGGLEVVRGLARTLGTTLAESLVFVPEGASWEANARSVRRDALQRLALGFRFDAVALGHHLDDQAETLMDRLLRGTGVAGAASMARRDDIWIRPLLGVRRTELAQVCVRHGVSPWQDPTNAQLGNTRSWIRGHLFPEVQRFSGRDPAVPLARFAEIARDESALLDELAHTLLASAQDLNLGTANPDVAVVNPGAMVPGCPLSVRTLNAVHPALARRALRLWLGYPRPDEKAVSRMMDVVSGTRIATEVSGYGRVARRRGLLFLERFDPVGVDGGS